MATRLECYFGGPGSAKSTAVAAVIAEMYKETGKKARVCIGDGSRATYEDAGLVDEGIVEIIDYSLRPWPLSTVQQLCEGYWPANVHDPKSPLLAPKPEDLQKLGVFAFEGLSVGGNYLMGDNRGGLADSAARGIKIGQDSPVMAKDVEYDSAGKEVAKTGTGMVFGGNPVAHYGFAQRRMLSNIERTKLFPGIVIWTAHERLSDDKVTNTKLIGPEVVGGAMTANISRTFNNTLHFATVEKKIKVEDEHTKKAVDVLDVDYRIYTRDHFQADGTQLVKYRAVTRFPIGVDPKLMPLYLESSIPGASILEFYKILAKAREEARSKFHKPESVGA